MTDKEVLLVFLSMDLCRGDMVFDKFMTLGGIEHRGAEKWQRFWFLPPTREDAVIFVAHADTVFRRCTHDFIEKDGFLYSTTPKFGLGADDRAGCAMLWLMKDSGHGLLLTDGEERGSIGAKYLMSEHPDIADAVNRASFLVELDRQGNHDFKCYSIPVTEEFKRFIAESTGYDDAGNTRGTDITSLCRDICGVNLSVGYYDEHTENERLCLKDWEHTLAVIRKLASGGIKRYTLAEVDNNACGNT